MSERLDQRVRLATFQWLRAQIEMVGEVLPRALPCLSTSTTNLACFSSR
jgi:hypothetical protein